MQLFCPACQVAFSALSHCPKCGVRLLSPQESFITNGRGKPPPPDPIAADFATRLLVGTAISVAIVFGLRELTTALSLWNIDSGSERWDTSNADPITFAIRLFAVLIGGLIAGAGRRQGVQAGTAVGMIVGGLLTAVDFYAAGHVQDHMVFLLALVYPLIAGLAGATGSWLWPADAVLPEPKHMSSHGSSMAQLAVEDAARRKERSTAWFRIAFAATLIVIGVIASDPIRYALAKNSAGLVNTGGLNRGPTLGLQIAAVITLLAGIFAGMGTGAGLKHGFFAGLLAGTGLLITSTSRANGLFPALEGFLNFFEIDHERLTSPRIAVNVMLGLLTLTSLAGWLGGQLFPPLAPRRMWAKSMQQQS